jgi:hypothetical protein
MVKKTILVSAMALAAWLAFSLCSGDAVWVGARATQPRPTATAQPLPPDYTPSAAPAPEALPDLVVQSIRLTPTNPYVKQGVKIEVTIKNIGAGDVEAGNNFFLDLYINPPTDDLRGMPGDYYWDVQGYLMKAGQSATFSVTLDDGFPDTVSYNLWAQVDTPDLPAPPRPYGWVLEAKEDNNVLGPQYVTIRTPYAWVQKDHVDFFRNMASTLDVVPSMGTAGIITNTPGLVINGDSALALGIFDEPPRATWGLSPTIPPASMPDYNMLDPDTEVNTVETNYQRYPMIHAAGDLVVAVWEDGQKAPTYGKDVFLRWSDDRGESWHDPIQVNETFHTHDRNDQKSPSVAVALDGTIVVVWQDHRDSSFDIYVQAFLYTGADLRRCQKNGTCATACNAAATECNFRVDTDAQDQDQILPDVAVDKGNNFYIAWQDQRNGNDDVFAVRSYYSGVACVTERESLGFGPSQVAESMAAPDATYLCWAGDTRINDDPGATKQAAPSITAVDGVKVTGIDYEVVVIDPGPPAQVEIVVTDVHTKTATYVVATWEDWREGDADIYLTYSDDGGETFVVDQRLNNDKSPNSTNGVQQSAPAAAVNQWMKWMTVVAPTPYGPAEGQVELPVTTMHIVWEDYRHSSGPGANDDPDIYYTALSVEPDPQFPWPLIISVQTEQEQVNDNDERAWQEGPVWQGEPDVAATASGLTLGESEGYNAYVIWADGRNYGGEFENTDVYFRLFSNVGEPTTFVGGNNIMLNDNARLYDFDTLTYTDYRKDIPPHARQHFPSIASTLVADWPTIFGGYIYVVWDDDRISDPFADRNIYFARSNLLFGGHGSQFDAPPPPPGDPVAPGDGEVYASGAFVSEVFDSGSDETVWYTVDWHAVRDGGTYITLQTRIGNSREEVLNGDWYPKRFPYPDDALSKGSPLQGYDAPGQHIVSAAGAAWPQARFIQYRVNFWARDTEPDPGLVELRTPFLYDVILHYDRPPNLWLPLVLKNYHK